jgi:acyl carrier protein
MPMHDDLRSTVFDSIRALKPAVAETAITPQASLTADLGLDSVDLVELSARITADFPACDITPWLWEASEPGRDTLDSFVTHLERQIAEAAPPGSGDATGGRSSESEEHRT